MLFKIVGIFLFSIFTVFGQVKTLSSIKDIKVNVVEETYIENKTREKKYDIKLILPNLMLKKITFPEINKGEAYLYKAGKRYVYLPIFDEITEEPSDKDTNYFLETLNTLIEKEKKDKKFKDQYYKKQVKILKFKDNIKVEIEKYDIIDGYLLPSVLKIFDGDIKVATLKLSNTKINSGLKPQEFVVKYEDNK
ncbi:hypothetical protein H3N56_09075 [Cetobacterium sp. 2A]|uniref:hypothetical protein n=1 Tax=Cetobacterium sp. 2A TaxID=2754723 RepID=UPI00163CF899|nr:hypothetical protein [Cetobacterium sp. 2A]MBC2856597.1 hypothetical protein [Cetobacterium sp. 2A]